MISIILNTNNHRETTEKYLPKMIESCGVESQVLINDNNSTDGLREFLKNYDTIYQDDNIGCPQGLNLLLPKCKFDYIAKIDPDFIMPENWGQKAMELISSNPEIGLVGFYWARGLVHPDLQKGAIDKYGENVIFVPKKVFGCWVFHRSVIDKVGMFYDEWKYGNWDTEFNERLKRNGYVNIYHRNDSIHMGVDTKEEREEKNKQRENRIIPELMHYKLDEWICRDITESI